MTSADLDPDLTLALPWARELAAGGAEIPIGLELRPGERIVDPARWRAWLAAELADLPAAGSWRSSALVRDLFDLDRAICRTLRERGEWP